MKKYILVLVMAISWFGGYSQTESYSAGTSAGNTSGSYNTSVGNYSGDVITGTMSSFFGYYSGKASTNASHNSFFGANAGRTNVTGLRNTYLGAYAGYS